MNREISGFHGREYEVDVSFLYVAPCILKKLTDVSGNQTASIIGAIALMIEAEYTSETSVILSHTSHPRKQSSLLNDDNFVRNY